MRPLVGPQYVVPGTKVSMPKDMLQSFQDQLDTLNLGGMRPSHRSKDRLDVDCGFGVLMLDHSIVPSAPTAAAGDAVAAIPSCVDLCVEIKPKAGVLPPAAGNGSSRGSEAAGAGSGSETTRPTCRYCQHQVLKALEATGCSTDPGASPLPATVLSELASTLSHYCPLDLYSGEPKRVLRALRALVRCPQNNFRLFAGGQPVFTHESAANYRRSRACETALSAGEASAAGVGVEASAPAAGEAGDAWSPEDCVSHLEEVLEDVLTLPPASGLGLHLPASRPEEAGRGTSSLGTARRGIGAPESGLPRHCDLIIRVLAAILCQDGLLRSLAAAQALDDCGPDAALAAFQRAAALAASSAPAGSGGSSPAAGPAATKDGGDGGTASDAPAATPSPSPSADAKAVAPAVESACAAAVAAADAAAAAGGGALADARQRELAEAGRLLSRFMLAASAKDCSLLIAFRLQLPSTSAAAEAAGDSTHAKAIGGAGAAGTADADADVAATAGLAAAGHPDGAAAAAAIGGSFSSLLGDDHPGRNSGSITIDLAESPSATAAAAAAVVDGDNAASAHVHEPAPGSTEAGRGGTSHRRLQVVSAAYSLAVVDLDPKPLARIPQYAVLDARIRGAFAAHGAAMFAAAGKACGAWGPEA